MPEATLNPAAVVLKVRCHYCSRWKIPADIMAFGDHRAIKMCHNCYQSHTEAVRALSTGDPPTACAICRRPFKVEETGEGTRIALHYDSGHYLFLCPTCDASYVMKRKDLYGDTPFGDKLKMKR